MLPERRSTACSRRNASRARRVYAGSWRAWVRLRWKAGRNRRSTISGWMFLIGRPLSIHASTASSGCRRIVCGISCANTTKPKARRSWFASSCRREATGRFSDPPPRRPPSTETGAAAGGGRAHSRPRSGWGGAWAGAGECLRAARELGVDYLVEGSMRDEGIGLRVSVELVDATTATALWSDTYVRPRDELP